MPAERSGPVAGILLAAGTSSRMGSNKLLFALEGESVLRRAVRRALAGGLSPLFVVLGHEPEKAWREVEDLPCTWAQNPLYAQGINTSLKAGVLAARGDDDLVNGIVGAAIGLDVFGNSRAQRRQPEGVAVVGLATPKRLLASLDDVRRRIEIRVAAPELYDVGQPCGNVRHLRDNMRVLEFDAIGEPVGVQV